MAGIDGDGSANTASSSNSKDSCNETSFNITSEEKTKPTTPLPDETTTSATLAVPDEFCQCYCKKERNFNNVELQCNTCMKWFHEKCIDIPLSKCLPFMTNYAFVCKTCSPVKMENFTKKQSNFSQMCITAIANLIQKSISNGTPKTMFSKDKDIIPFIDKHWECLTTMPRRIKQTWHQTIHKTLVKDSDIFASEGEAYVESPNFGLIHQDLHKIGPSYESLVRPVLRAETTVSASGMPKGRAAKRKLPGSDSQGGGYGKRAKSDLVIPKLPAHGYPLDHPFNKDGYRYNLAEPDPHAPFRQEFDESQDWAGKPIPGWLYRVLNPTSMLLAMHDRAPQLKVHDDRLTASNEKGYCMVRGIQSVSYGTWYYEVTMQEMPDNSATRLGWAQQLANLQGPLGYDKFGYSWRSRKGTKFHESKGVHYTDQGYGQGDVIGILIHLPLQRLALPNVHKEKPLVKFKSYLYFEEKDETSEIKKSLKSLPRSKIVFYRNGVNMGTAWSDIYVGRYYPAVSLYKGCTVSVNFGPHFKHSPQDTKFRPMSEATELAAVEQTLADTLYFVENEGKLSLDL